MKTTMLVGLPALLLLSLVLEASCKDPCSKDWLRFMVVNACGMDKRHLERKKPSIAPSLKEILSEVDEEFENWRLGNPSPFESEDDDIVTNVTNVTIQADVRDKDLEASDKFSVSTKGKGFFTRLFEHPMQLLSEEWLGLTTEPKRMPRRRAIQNAISRCCSENCDEDAFEGVCD